MREMKDSGITWIGEIGRDYRLFRLKNICHILDEFRKPITADQRNQDADILYDYYGASGIIDKIDGYTIDDHVMLIGEDGANLRLRNLPLMYEVNGKAWINNHAHILKPIDSIVNFSFLFFLLESLDLNPYITGSAQPKLNQENLRNIVLPIPSLPKQQVLATYIRSRINTIDALIANQQQQIDKLKQYKQAVITEAVTRGLDPNVRMKDSGVEWIGEVPEHWRIIRGKWLFHETNERSKTGEEELLSVSHITGITPRSQKNVNMFMAESLVDYKICHVNDIASNTMWMWQGAIGVSKFHGVISPSYNTYRQTNSDYDSRYLDYMLRIEPIIHEYISRSSGIVASRLRLYPVDFFEIMFFVPPKNEQQEIVAYLDTNCAKIDALITLKQQKADKLVQYKKSLIYEVVTGKREV